MQRRSTRASLKRISNQTYSDDDFDEPKNKKKERNKPSRTKNKNKITDSSSSESDIENYLKPADEIDLNSSFFKNDNNQEEVAPSFDDIEEKIFSGIKVARLSDSDSSEDEDNITNKTKKSSPLSKPTNESTEEEKISKSYDSSETTTGFFDFQTFQEYKNKIEEVKKNVELYNEKLASEEVEDKTKPEDHPKIVDLLTACETKREEKLHSSKHDTYSDSEQEDWEEIDNKQEQPEKSVVPETNLEITVEMPTTMRKKKGDDLLAAVKRRLNRIRKENQVLIHKVHLLGWIAHGNYVNNILNDENMLSLGLSLLPSEKSYPSGRIDLNYLEQIVKWFKKTFTLTDEKPTESGTLSELLTSQIAKKEAHSKKMLVLIFILVLRSLGIQCRLVLSLQPEPLRPPTKDLHFLGNPATSKKTDGTSKVETRKIEPHEKAELLKKINEKLEKNIPEEKVKKEIIKEKKVDVKEDNEKEKPRLQDKKSSKKIKIESPKKEDKKESKKPSKSSDKKKPSSSSHNTRTTRSNSKNLTVPDNADKNKRSRSTSLRVNLEKIDENFGKTRSKSTSSATDKSKSTKIVQLDGCDENSNDFKGFSSLIHTDLPTFENFYAKMYNRLIVPAPPTTPPIIPQLDGGYDDKPKPNLKKLKETKRDVACGSRTHRGTKKPIYTEPTTTESDDCFEPSPKKKIKLSPNVEEKKRMKDVKVNLTRLKEYKTSGNTEKSPTKPLDVTKDIMQLIKGRITEQKSIDRSRKVKKRKPSKMPSDSEEDSDYVPEAIVKKYKSESEDEFYPKMKVKQRVQPKKNVIKKLKKPKDTTSRKVISSDSEYTEEEIVEKSKSSTEQRKKRGNDTWLEVFLETEEKWMSVDIAYGQVHCISELYSRASHPVSYILAWSNGNYIKDITRRYCQNFNTITRKLRVDNQWWEATLKPFMGPKTARDKEEDDELNREQMEKPLPTTISEYKNHPLYVLERHLLKFEVLYPPNAPPLGFIRKEPVYSRDCVYVCHSRDIWLKQAKVVKRGEKPYKIVKARPKYDKLSNSVITGQLLEIFGPWQVEDYDPPTAENGIVPRNAFGNVDLFKPSMLPKKCVHLNLPGLNKVARKLNIDCASAIVGFDFHGGWSHPVYEGFVVCEEFEDQLVAAWNMEQEELEKKENEKYEKRVYGNWKKLIKGLLIRERLKAKYGFGKKEDDEENTSGSSDPKNIAQESTTRTKKRRVISDSSDSD